jgi:hypothetical protein
VRGQHGHRWVPGWWRGMWGIVGSVVVQGEFQLPYQWKVHNRAEPSAHQKCGCAPRAIR